MEPLLTGSELVLSEGPYDVSQIPTWSERPVNVAPLCVKAYVPVSWQTGLTYCSVQSQTPAMLSGGSAAQATAKLTCVVSRDPTSMSRGFAPATVQFGARPLRRKLWLPAGRPGSIRASFTATASAEPPSSAIA